MRFEAGNRRKAIEYEKDLIKQWKRNKTFEKSVEQRPKDNAYVFYDGPPFITGVPHHGTLLSSIVKDAVPRYWTMQGKRVERVWGWDCHGLPAEVFTEKKLGFKDRRDIGTKISLEEYIVTARENMVQTSSLWEDTIDRIGRWVNFQGAYKTMDKEYMESIWWAFRTLYEKGKIYEGERVLMYCTRDATPLSKAEVTMDTGSYQEVTDPSVYVKFKLKDEDAYLLAWTTTPWTLPANTAVAVNAGLTYAEVELEGQKFILARELLDKALTDEKHQPLEYRVLRELKGNELVGKSYEPLFVERGENAHKVWAAEYVSAEDGTGVVHLAPAYGEEDFELAQEKGIPVVHVIDENGFYTESDWQGENVWEANKPIAKALLQDGRVWKIEYYRHSYPHCHRCGTRLMYRAHPSWFMDILGQKQDMLDQNENIDWFPEHIKEGRFRKNLEAAPDWNLSRDRFWATAMPVWKSEDGDIKVIGSYAELKELSGVELEDYHRPWVDDIEFDLDGKHYKRIDKVMDGWFESGSMPFAQFHYPFENKEKFESSFPGDFIAEYIGQVRAWFYYLHAVNVGLFGKNAFKHVIVTGTLAGNDGRKMSKSYGNFTDPNVLMDEYSADALRFLLLSSPVLNGEDFALQDKDVRDVSRKLGMIWNMYDFFTTYASVDGWEWPAAENTQASDAGKGPLQDPLASEPSWGFENPLDIWIVSRLHQLQAHIEEHMNAYDLPGALEPVLAFVDDASNWYVRRSRRRFWKSGDSDDKYNAYWTLHYVLVRLSIILAPFVPFLAEELFQKLTGGKMGESVHLLDWPQNGAVDEVVVRQMAYTREAITDGLAKRAEAGIKVRQPLRAATIWNAFKDAVIPEGYAEIIREELNVKVVSASRGAEGEKGPMVFTELDTEITPELKREGLMRELVRQVQAARKAAGLQVDDRITLQITSEDDEVLRTLTEQGDTIKAETLAVSLNETQPDQYRTEVTVEGFLVTISLAKV